MMKQQLGSLKPVQLSELEAEFEKVEGKAKPERLLRSQQVWSLSQLFVSWTFFWLDGDILLYSFWEVFLYPSGQVKDFWKVDQKLSTKYVASSSEVIKEKLPRVTPHHEIPCIESEK